MILGVKYGLVERVIKPNGDNIYAIAVHPGTVGFGLGRLADFLVGDRLA